MALFPGTTRLGERDYSDIRQAGKDRDPDLARQPELDWYMSHYSGWRQMYDGSALEETINTSEDPSKTSDQQTYRWPVRYNLVKSYCLLHAGFLWGRGRTGAEASDLFDIHIDPYTGTSKPATAAAPNLEDVLQFFWSQQANALRPNGVIQMWAGGCVLKVNWNPWSSSHVFGVQIETVQPEHFYPIWDPLNFEDLMAVKIKFPVSKAVAELKYGLTKKQLERYADSDSVPVTEYWDKDTYAIILGTGDSEVVARSPFDGKPMSGDNPWRDPVTRRGLIPFVYVPRIRTGGFFGESLAYDLEGLQSEINKTLADYGDALTRGAHPAFGISDFHGPSAKTGVIAIPRHGALNLGSTKPGMTAPKVHEFPAPEVPSQTEAFTDKLLSLSETTAGLTPASRGAGSGSSGLAMAMEMLPTVNLVDWERSHWEHAIRSINRILVAIWSKKDDTEEGRKYVPSINDSMLRLRQRVEFRPVIPRDRIEVIDEVVRLATARAVSPQEWLRRLGDIEDPEGELKNLYSFLAGMAVIEAAVAGHKVTISESENPEEPPKAVPELSGDTAQPATRQPAKQPQGMKNATGRTS